ncbi:hypothetical protein ACTPGW_002608 [Enterococcus faecalis]
MTSVIENVGFWALNITLLVVGFGLIISGIFGVGSGLWGKNKEYTKAVIGLLIGILGGFLGWWGASNVLEFFKSNGQDIPL